MRVLRIAGPVCALLAALLCAGTAWSRGAEISAEMQARAQVLLDRMQQGDGVNVVVYGDSITDGWGTDGTHVYHRIFLDSLRYRFPDCSFECQVQGNPGWTTADALRGFDRQVARFDPDLLIVQFGGNDRGWGRPLTRFRAGLAELLTAAASETEALVIACMPPIAEEIGDNEWSTTAREVAVEAGVPAAWFHRAIEEGPHDFRSSFPFGSHPGSFTHVLMARELMRGFDAAVEMPPKVACQFVRRAELSADPEFVVSATISSTAGEAVDWSVRLEFGREVRELEGTATPGEPVTVSERFSVPEALPAGRAWSIPIRAWARAEGTGAFDVAWLTIAPAITVSGNENSPTEQGGSAWQVLDGAALVLGKNLWQGPDDLSGRFRASIADEHLNVEIRVTDDQITVADLADPSRGDSVEVYIDLRSREGQGRPVYGEDVLALQIIPPAQPNGPAQWQNMHDLPDDLGAIQVTAALSEGGYRAEAALPLAALEARRGEDWGGIGLDVGINDADGGTRRTQMMWAGTADNYLNPAYLAGVYPRDLPARATRRVLK